MLLKSYNPSNQKLLGEVEVTSKVELERMVQKSKHAFQNWKTISLGERLQFLKCFYKKIQLERETIAQLVTKEMGMPITESLGDIDQGLDYIDWYIKNSPSILKNQVSYENSNEVDQIVYEPKGVVAVIIAWNFPFSVFVWQVIPNLIVGNVVILKHSEYVPLCSQLFNELLVSIVPQGVYQTVYGDGKTGEALVNQEIDMICFTGSTSAGQKLSRIAGEKMIPIILECGGSAAGIVLEDVEVDSIIDSIYLNRFTNTGQVCDGLKRLIVHESKVEEVCDKLVNLLSMKKVGDPLLKNTDLGPLVSKKAVQKIEMQVQDATLKGAKIICAKNSSNLKDGNYYKPILLRNITRDMKVWKEEVFGPVLPIITFQTMKEAIELANDTPYGLGGYIYTNDSQKFEMIARELNTGMVAWNQLYYLRPENPFGGIKKSGLGRVNSNYGFINLCNIKVITYQRD